MAAGIVCGAAASGGGLRAQTHTARPCATERCALQVPPRPLRPPMVHGGVACPGDVLASTVRVGLEWSAARWRRLPQF